LIAKKFNFGKYTLAEVKKRGRETYKKRAFSTAV